MFSILPPQGPNWFIGRQSAYEVWFMKKLLNTPWGRADVLHTFIVSAEVSPLPGIDLESPTGVQQFLYRVLGSPPKFRVQESQTVSDSSFGPGCTRYDSLVEERNNPRAPGAVLMISAHGFICPHPHVPSVAVHLAYSERYIQGMLSWLTEVLTQEAETSLRSVVFKPVQ